MTCAHTVVIPLSIGTGGALRAMEERTRAQSVGNVVQAFVQHHIDQIEPVAKLIATQPQVATALAAAPAAATPSPRWWPPSIN